METNASLVAETIEELPKGSMEIINITNPMISKLTGKFHAHFTVDGSIEEVMSVAKGSGMKPTIIRLYDGRNEQVDPMLTRYYFTETPNLDLIEARIRMDLEKIAYLGLHVIRVKLEHEGEQDGELDHQNYLEEHLKMRFSPSDYVNMLEKIEPKMPELGFVLSKNPYGFKENVVHHFANVRIKTGSVSDAKTRVYWVAEKLSEIGVNFEEIKIELNVWDSNQKRDVWWA